MKILGIPVGKESKRLSETKERYEKSRAAAEIQQFEKNWKQYKGDKEVPGGKPLSIQYNFTYELIETEVDSTILFPKVQPVNPTPRSLRNAQVIENMLRGEFLKQNPQEINDVDERTTYIMGGDVFMLEWDNSKSTPTTVGQVNLRVIPPPRFIPQEGVTDVKSMDYVFVDFSDTKERIKARYGVSVESEGADADSETTNDEIVTLHVEFYMNESGKLGCFAWVGDTVVIDDEDYEARKDDVCAKCGKTRAMGEDVCPCGSKKWVKRPQYEETLDEDVVLHKGTPDERVIPAKTVVISPDGIPETEDYDAPVIDSESGSPVVIPLFDDKMNVVGEKPLTETRKRPKLKQTKLPYYTPSSIPVVVRRNVSSHEKLFGDSDCSAIYDLQLATNKLLSKTHKKLMAAGSILTKPSSVNFEFSDEEVKPLNLDTPSEKSMIDSINLSPDVSQDLNVAQMFYNMARSVLGISDTFQGKPDTTATSGVAKQASIQQSAGRLVSKRTMKESAYSQIFRMWFQYMLAYADEPRYYATTDMGGQPVQSVFNRYDFLEQDEFGNWYYDDQYIFTVDNSGAVLSDRTYLLNDLRTDFGLGAYGAPDNPESLVLYWKEKESLNFPNAKRMVAHWEKKAEETRQLQAQMAQQQQAMAQQQQGQEAQTKQNEEELRGKQQEIDKQKRDMQLKELQLIAKGARNNGH